MTAGNDSEGSEDGRGVLAAAPDERTPGEAGSGPDELRAYSRLKLALAAQVRFLREAAHARGDRQGAERCAALVAKLAEDRFTLAVLGQFKRGKSSLMNALIGRELLPVGVLPLTSAITILRYGSEERLLIRHEGWAQLREAPIGQLADYVTQEGNPGNSRRVQAAYVELPLPLLRRGLEFVDTPGIGSAIEANTATTYRFLASCDAAVFVTSADAPLTGAELAFLRDLRPHARKLFFALNKTDLLLPAERVRMLAFAEQAIRREWGGGDLLLFPVSARLGLAARLQGDPSGYARSGVEALEEALAAFLAGERSSVFLASVADKAALVAKRGAEEEEIAARARAADGSAADRRAEFEKRLAAAAGERSEILRLLRERIVRESAESASAGLDGLVRGQETALPRRLQRLLGPARRLPAGIAAKRMVPAVVRAQERAMGAWIDAWSRGWGPAADPRSLSRGAALARNLGSAMAAAADLLGIAYDRSTDPDVLPRWEPTALPARPRCETDGRARMGLRAALPVALARASVLETVAACARRHLSALRKAALESAALAAGGAFDAWSADVDAAAAAAEARARAALAGGPAPAAAGKEPPWPRILGRLRRLSREIAGLRSGGSLPEPEEDLPPIEAEADAGARPEEVRFDPARALQSWGCPVCNHVTNAAFSFFAQLQYRLHFEEDAQAAFAAGMGLCPAHLWQLEAVSSPTGTSAGHARLVASVAGRLARAARTPRAARALPALASPGGCGACRRQREEEAASVARLAEFLRDAGGREAYRRSQGVCLRHLEPLADAAADEETSSFVLLHAARRFEELSEDLQGYALKTEGLRRELRTAEEEDAYKRALTHLAGDRRLAGG